MHGKLTCKFGDEFEGTFNEGEKDTGFGQEINEKGDLFKGTWEKGRRSIGKENCANGDVFEGEWGYDGDKTNFRGK